MRTQQDARVAAGDDHTLAIAVANLGGADLTGMTANYIVAAYPIGSPPPLISKSTASGIAIVTDPVPAGYAAVLKVRLNHADTADLTPGWYYHEAEVKLSNDSVVTVMTGQLRIDPSWIASSQP